MCKTTPLYQADIRIGPCPSMPRQLRLELGRGHLYVTIASGDTYIGSTDALLQDCYLDISAMPRHAFLSVGRASFPVSEPEIATIRAALEPHGLHVVEAS